MDTDEESQEILQGKEGSERDDIPGITEFAKKMYPAPSGPWISLYPPEEVVPKICWTDSAL